MDFTVKTLLYSSVSTTSSGSQRPHSKEISLKPRKLSLGNEKKNGEDEKTTVGCGGGEGGEGGKNENSIIEGIM